MSIYSVKGKGWRYDFKLRGKRYTNAWYKTKREARQAASQKREELKKPLAQTKIQTDIEFLELVNRWLDRIKVRRSDGYYEHCVYKARRWLKRWRHFKCSELTEEMMEAFVTERSKISNGAANREIRYLRASFNLGRKKKWISINPLDGIESFPEEVKVKYVPPQENIDKVISVADPDTADYLWTIRETLGRMGEVNRLDWSEDVDFEHRYVVLRTRKKKNGNLTPRKVPMTEKLFEILTRRFASKDPDVPWVFWHTYTSSKTGERKKGPYRDRKKIMKSLCAKAGVKYFRFHPLRHAGASLMDDNDVPIGAIQKVLGHEKRSTTEIYLHQISPKEREAMATYERARQNSHTNSHTAKEGHSVKAVTL